MVPEWLVHRLIRLLRQHGLPLATIGGLLLLFGGSLEAAEWVPGVTVQGGLWLAALLGLLLARSRFTGRFAFAYLALLVVLGGAEKVGRILPWGEWLARAPAGEWIWLMHLRALTLGGRMGDWIATVRSGGVVQDVGLFVWLFSGLAWGAGAWLAWWVVRARQGWLAALPAAALLALNVHLSGQSWLWLWGYGLIACLLLAGCALARQREEWDRRGVDYPDGLALDWALPAAGLTLVVGAAAALAPVAGTPQGWDLLAGLVRSTRDEAAEAAGQLFGGVNPPRVEPAGLALAVPDLSQIGPPIDQSQATVMWVWVSDPPPPARPEPVPEAVAGDQPPQHHWRSAVYATYTGQGWEPLDVAGSAAAPHPAGPPAGRYALEQRYEIVALHAEELFAVSVPVTASTGAQVVADTDAGTALVRGPASTYQVLSWAAWPTAAELRATGGELPPDIAARYLQLPEDLPGRVRDLAQQLGAGAADNYERAVRVQDYLRRAYPYTLDVPAPPPGRDAVDYFLYEAPGGFCTYYASAMAVLLRAQGVPARLAAGYAMGVYDPERAAYRVPGWAAHAWVEVYFPGYGWVEFEPTPSQPVFDYPAGVAEAEVASQPLPALEAPQPNRPFERAAWLLAAAGALLAYGAWRAWDRYTRRALSARAQALRLYHGVRRALAWAGLAAGPSLTADEFLALQLQDPGLRRHPQLHQALAQVTALFREAAYSPHRIGGQQLADAAQLWRRARPAWLRLLLARRLRPRRPGE